jgi:putative nucleotidyltransferase with HDIG domain
MPSKTKNDAIALSMRVVHVAFDVEMGHRCFGGLDGALAVTREHAGVGLDPKLVDLFHESANDVIAAIEQPSVWAAAMAAEPAPQRVVEGAEIDEALLTMSTFADLKSRYTRGHSSAVAELAAAAAREAGLGAELEQTVRRAGLLHDIGRVAISAGVWDKAAALTDLEREKIRMHTYVGERVLARAPSLSAVAEVACLAHERLDGSGYHRKLSAQSCTAAARLLAAADVYRAMREDRPHRAAKSADEAATELRAMADAGTLCPDAARAVLAAAGHNVKKKVERPHGLTDREIEVLRLLARGLTNKEIANALDISTKTAGHHVQHIFEKLAVTTRAAAAIHAMTLGITA